jgi:hypothetical protein
MPDTMPQAYEKIAKNCQIQKKGNNQVAADLQPLFV